MSSNSDSEGENLPLSPPLPRSDTPPLSHQSSLEISTSSTSKTCSWCKNFRLLLPNKSYCQSCFEKMHRECSRCHLPFPQSKYFQEGNRRCNSCHKKYLKEKEKRIQRQNQQQKQQTAATTSLSSSSSPPVEKPRTGTKRPAAASSRGIEEENDNDEKDEEKMFVMKGGQRVVWKKDGKCNVIVIV